NWPVHQPSGRSSPKAAGNKLPDARHGPHIGASAQQKALFRLSLGSEMRQLKKSVGCNPKKTQIG
ncbi:hypothetical protein, partial [Roseovarius sp. A46]|uniref:hypothetical protein n=1 Tax=Roseovarius sp. A46 TaxID=2109331 RepID=UPI0019D6BA54